VKSGFFGRILSIRGESARDSRERSRTQPMQKHRFLGLIPTTDLLLDRGMMGDGIIDIRKIRGWLEAAEFRGWSEVEIFSARNWWQRPGDEVLATCIERHRTVV